MVNKNKQDRFSSLNQRILSVDITVKALSYNPTIIDVMRLVLSLQVEYWAYKEPIPEPHVNYSGDPFAIAGIYDAPDGIVKVCICQPDELEEDNARPPNLLYPRKAPIGKTISLPQLVKRMHERSESSM